MTQIERLMMFFWIRARRTQTGLDALELAIELAASEVEKLTRADQVKAARVYSYVKENLEDKYRDICWQL